ncbi:hypothetical protein [Dehalobacter sp. TeCB1]|uniref:hypothetical protein n=1 Tax=Dehalobacter sp. TeCB1 TaxID=1843715 RepID=UPI0011470BB8|nr:hypothetical protein [Dehalobacter sp. TeCB1]
MKERLKICWVEVEEEGFRFKYFYPKSIEFNSTDLNEIKLLGCCFSHYCAGIFPRYHSVRISNCYREVGSASRILFLKNAA